MCAGTALVLLLVQTLGLADGYRNPPEGAAAQGRAGARYTQGDDPSTVTFNPANLMDLERQSVMLSAGVGYSQVKYTSPLGQSEDSEDPWRILPAVFAAWALKDGDYVAGLGIHMPYGQSTEWDKDGFIATVAPYFAQMKTVNLNPSIATRIGKNLSVGVGLDVMWSELESRTLLAGSELKLTGDGESLGGNIGLTWQLSDRQRLAATYRSPMSVTYKGDSELSGLPGTDFETEIDFPTTVGIGYGIHLTDAVRLEANAEWVEHSRNQELGFDLGGYNQMLEQQLGTEAAQALLNQDQSWDDTWTVAVGADWAFAPCYVLRAGWTFLPTPIPGETLMPYLPQGDKNVFALGLGYSKDDHSFDVAYSVLVTDDRDLVAGKYEFNIHLIGLSYDYSF